MYEKGKWTFLLIYAGYNQQIILNTFYFKTNIDISPGAWNPSEIETSPGAEELLLIALVQEPEFTIISISPGARKPINIEDGTGSK